MAFRDLHFTIDGISSQDLGVDGLYIIRTDNDMTTRKIMGTKTVNKDKPRNRDIGYFMGTEKSNIEFELKFSLIDEKLTDEVLYRIGEVFGKDKYVEFESSDYPGFVFYVIALDIELSIGSLKKGWITIYLESSAPYALKKEKITTYNLSSLTVPQKITIENISNVMNPKFDDYIYQPKLEVEILGGNTGFTLKNITNNNKIFGFTDLTVDEKLTIYNDKLRIESETGEPRISKLINKDWFKLVKGVNYIEVDTPMILKVTENYPVYI